MPPIPMKEIRMPSALLRQRQPAVAYAIVKSFGAGFIFALLAFFVVNVSSIAILAIIAASRHRMIDFSIVYRYIAAPAALVVLALDWPASLIFFLRER